MSSIPWTTVDPDIIERIIAVGLCRRHTQARRVKPSQGDGGLDVLVPNFGNDQLNVENYQVKKFADTLTADRKRQIKESLGKAIKTHNSQKFGYNITRWHLALPMDLTREQEKWLFDTADELECPFPVEIFGLTRIEELLLEAAEIREYYIGDGLDRIRDAMVQMNNYGALTKHIADPLAIQPDEVTASIASVHQSVNSADPHFSYDYEVTAEPPSFIEKEGRIASVTSRVGAGAPYVTWHISARYDTALQDRAVPGGFEVYPEHMSEEQRADFERWHDYGTPLELGGDAIGNISINLPGGLGGEFPNTATAALSIGPSSGEADREPAGRALWIIEDGDANPIAEMHFTFRLQTRGIGGGEHRQGSDAEGYLTADILTKQTGSSNGSIKIELHLNTGTWSGQPAQRVLPAIRFAAAWAEGNSLRASDEFRTQIADETLPLKGEALVENSIVETIEDLVRISAAVKKTIALPNNIRAISRKSGGLLRLMADAISGLEPRFAFQELTLWYKDHSNAAEEMSEQAKLGELLIPWSQAFPMLGDGFELTFQLALSGEFELAFDQDAEKDRAGHKSVRVIPSVSATGRLRWAPPA